MFKTFECYYSLGLVAINPAWIISVNGDGVSPGVVSIKLAVVPEENRGLDYILVAGTVESVVAFLNDPDALIYVPPKSKGGTDAS